VGGFQGIEAETIVDGFFEILAGSEIAFGGLNGSVAEQKLNLFEVSAGGAA
jgi:hypothetical protein